MRKHRREELAEVFEYSHVVVSPSRRYMKNMIALYIDPAIIARHNMGKTSTSNIGKNYLPGKYIDKKCVPGVFCIENMTLGLLVLIGVMVSYLFYVHFTKPVAPMHAYSAAPVASFPTAAPAAAIAITTETADPRVAMSNPYEPPLKTESTRAAGHGVVAMMQNVIPVNISTSVFETAYSQVGILTKSERGGKNDGQMILPLMGRNLRNGRDKWQYYTMTNGSGTINTKLPISVNGKSCTGEYGCDSISTGDVVYVEGYNDTFRATIYENALMRYLPI